MSSSDINTFFSSLDLFSGGSNDIIYISDMETYELLYVNDYLRKTTGNDLVGKLCYKELQGRDTPCPYCTNETIKELNGECYNWTWYNPLVKQHFYIIDKVITLPNGKRARYERARHLSEKELSKALEGKMLYDRLIQRISKLFSYDPLSYLEAMPEALMAIGETTLASRAYIFDIDHNLRTISNSFEWCAKSVVPQKELLQDIPYDRMPWWMGKLLKQEYIYIDDIDLLPDVAAQEKADLSAQGIQTLLVFPIVTNKEVSHFVGIDYTTPNNQWNIDNIRLFSLVVDSLSNGMRSKLAEENLAGAYNKYLNLFEHTGAASIILDSQGIVTLENQKGKQLLESTVVQNNNFYTAVRSGASYIKENIEQKEIIYQDFDIEVESKNGTNIFLTVTMGITDSAHFILSLVDITEKRRFIDELQYQSNHDMLTGVYNRNYFERYIKEHQNFSETITIVSLDLDGLKIINDTFGHSTGDKVLKTLASIMKKVVGGKGTCIRLGGDEFAIIFQNTAYTEVLNTMEQIRGALKPYNEQHIEQINISYGVEQSTNKENNIESLLRIADANMYTRKLLKKESSRNSAIQLLSAAIDARDYMTDGHGERLQSHMLALAKQSNLPSEIHPKLELFAKFHDLGKIAIPDSILLKPSKLTKLEFDVVKKHSETGYQIAASSTILSPIADLILHHHEWWDGTGYPNNISGKNIPVECRIISIIDAFDAMTNDRVFRKAMPATDAIEEIKQCSGSQFDPEFVELFLNYIETVI